MPHTRTHWREVVDTPLYHLIQGVLFVCGARLEVTLDDNQVATDVYVVHRGQAPGSQSGAGTHPSL
jgi:hypothetical protein